MHNVENSNKNIRLKVLITSNIPAPYFVAYLNELSKYCDVFAVFENKTSPDREDAWYRNEDLKFTFKVLNVCTMGTRVGVSFKILKFLSAKEFDRIIVANPTTPTGIIALLYCRWNKVPFIIQSEGGFQGSGIGFKEHFKKYIMEKAKYYLTGMGNDDDYFLAYGATKDKLRPYPFSSMYESTINKKLLSKVEKNVLRKELNVRENIIIISVGRFIKCKGFDILLKIVPQIKGDVGIYIIGGKPTNEYKSIITNLGINNVHFLEFCQPEILKKYYEMANIFILPTREDTWGLVINEAMANGLPVITTNKCIAGLQLIENGVNGYIVPTDDESELLNKINLLCVNKGLCERMGRENIEKIQKYSIENMTRVIFKALRST